MTEAVPLCKCGAPRPMMPRNNVYKSQCDRCEHEAVLARKRAARARVKSAAPATIDEPTRGLR